MRPLPLSPEHETSSSSPSFSASTWDLPLFLGHTQWRCSWTAQGCWQPDGAAPAAPSLSPYSTSPNRVLDLPKLQLLVLRELPLLAWALLLLLLLLLRLPGCGPRAPMDSGLPGGRLRGRAGTSTAARRAHRSASTVCLRMPWAPPDSCRHALPQPLALCLCRRRACAGVSGHCGRRWEARCCVWRPAWHSEAQAERDSCGSRSAGARLTSTGCARKWAMSMWLAGESLGRGWEWE